MTRAIAFYLPQYHPIPENDGWWGKGFTEWTNVTRAKPQFWGHYQPHLPQDLGFYDLRLPEVRAAQAELAKTYGVSGFCYFHYWFHGRRLLERPFDEVLKSRQPDLPFCLCWANEDWLRHGRRGERELLIEQNYSRDDDLQHMSWLSDAFADPRYIRIDGRPLFLVYRACKLPEPKATTERWRAEARCLGIGELFLARVESFPDERGDPRPLGFDAAVEFQPDQVICGNPSVAWRIGRRLTGWRRPFRHRILNYPAVVDRMLAKPSVAYPRFPCAVPSWDNTARHPDAAFMFKNSSPLEFERWVRALVERMPHAGLPEDLLFVNAWNEWAEGNHLEPCQRWGHGYLEACLRGLEQ